MSISNTNALDPTTWPTEAAAADEAAAIQRLRTQYGAAAKSRIPCPSCASADARPLVEGDRHGLDLTTVICGRCGLAYVSPRPEPAWFASFYQHEYWPLYLGARFRDADDMYERDGSDLRSRQIVDKLFAHLPEAPRSCFDVGCGQGALLKALRERVPAARFFGIEPSEEGAAYTRQRHGFDVWCGELDEFVSRAAPERYSLVTVIHVLEHVLDPNRFLDRLRAFVEPDGYVYIEVPDLLSPRWRGMAFFHIAHTLYWSQPSLLDALDRHGYEAVAWVPGASDQWCWAIGVLARLRRDGTPGRTAAATDIERMAAQVREAASP